MKRALFMDACVPAALRRPRRTAAITAVLGWAVGILVTGTNPLGLTVYTRLGLFMALIGAVAWIAVRCDRSSRRAIRRAAKADHLLCPDCTYDLRTLDETDSCPECGRAYEHDAVRAQWLDAERRIHGKK